MLTNRTCVARPARLLHAPRADASGEAAGNYAFLDQLAALHWMRRNIAASAAIPSRSRSRANPPAASPSCSTWPDPQRGACSIAPSSCQAAAASTGSGRPPVARAEQAGVAFAQSMGITEIGADARSTIPSNYVCSCEAPSSAAPVRQRHLMKYPPTCHEPSFSRIAVTVSTAADLCSKLALNWKTTYSPSGAPGSVVVDIAFCSVRDFI